MIIPQVRQVILRLIEKTKANEVNWFPADDLGLPTAPGGDDFAVSTPDTSLNIYRASGSDALVFKIFDGQGRDVYEVAAFSDEEDYVLLDELLKLARFKARGVEETLEHIWHFLETNEVIGTEPHPTEEELPF